MFNLRFNLNFLKLKNFAFENYTNFIFLFLLLFLRNN